MIIPADWISRTYKNINRPRGVTVSISLTDHIWDDNLKKYIEQPVTNVIDVPDNWFFRMSSNNFYRPSVSDKEQGYYCLTRIGWIANKDAIKSFVDSGGTNHYGYVITWAEFEKEIEKHFANIKTRTNGYVKMMNAKMNYLQNQLTKMQGML